MHVVRVQPHQLAGDRHRPRPALAAGAVGVVLARDKLDPPLVRNDILVAQAERLADPQPGAEQQREQEPVAQQALGTDHRPHVLERQRPRQPPLLAQPPHPPAWLGASDPMQKRLVAGASRPTDIEQRLRPLDPMAGVERIENRTAPPASD
jgi:hypothetical protein